MEFDDEGALQKSVRVKVHFWNKNPFDSSLPKLLIKEGR
jgi:hypothetical protein